MTIPVTLSLPSKVNGIVKVKTFIISEPNNNISNFDGNWLIIVSSKPIFSHLRSSSINLPSSNLWYLTPFFSTVNILFFPICFWINSFIYIIIFFFVFFLLVKPTTSQRFMSVGDLVFQNYQFKTKLPNTKQTLNGYTEILMGKINV